MDVLEQEIGREKKELGIDHTDGRDVYEEKTGFAEERGAEHLDGTSKATGIDSC